MATFNLSKCKIPSKPKGKMDTQLFPECKGTSQDQDVVTKNRKMKANDSLLIEAKKTKQRASVEELLRGSIKTNKGEWASTYDRALSILDSIVIANPTLPEDELEKQIVAKLNEEGIQNAYVVVAAASAIDASKRKTKSNTKSNTNPVVESTISTQPSTTSNDPVMAKKTTQLLKKADCGSEGNDIISVIYPSDGNMPEKKINIKIPEKIKNRTDVQLADWAWKICGNNVDGTKPENGIRSSMVGDVFTIRGKHYVALGAGWAELSCDELDKWTKKPAQDRLMAFNESRLREMLTQAFTNTYMLKQASKENK